MTSWLIDTHCHLDLVTNIQFKYQEEDALPIKTISVTNAPSFFEPNQRLFKDANNVRIAIGMHPELVSQFSSELVLFENVLQQTRYVGEIGLDGSERFKPSFNQQHVVFKEIVRLCAESGDKILTVHTRKAEKEAIQILRNNLSESNCKVILHWFTGNTEALKDGIKAGFYFSVNHKMMSTQKGQELVKNIPRDKLLTESDAPFTLANKMTRVESLNICIGHMSSVLQIESNELKKILFNNFKAVLS